MIKNQLVREYHYFVLYSNRKDRPGSFIKFTVIRSSFFYNKGLIIVDNSNWQLNENDRPLQKFVSQWVVDK